MLSDEESTAMMERYLKDMADHAQSRLEESKDIVDKFTELAKSKGIYLGKDSFSYVQTIGIVASAPGLACKLIGITPTERDGLFSYEEIARLFPPNFNEGYFAGSDYIFMAHPCYRRRMHPMANWAPRFVDLFWRLSSQDVRKYIAIDEDRVRIDIDGSCYMEADTWYGAPFNEDIGKIKNGISKLRPPSDLSPDYIDMFFSQTYCLDIKWSESSQIKTFQALEIKTKDAQVVIGKETFFPARYLHAEFDVSSGEFRHFDGAIQFFTEEEYFLRRDSDFNMLFKSNEQVKARSKKVFKLNGSIPVKLWVELCCHFFPANPLIFEYFTGSYPKRTEEIVENYRIRLNQQ